MRFQMRRVDHDALGSWALAGKCGEDAIEDLKPAPADEAIVKRLVWPVAFGRVLPLQAVLDDIDNAADHPSIVDARHAMRQRKERRNPRPVIAPAICTLRRGTGRKEPSQYNENHNCRRKPDGNCKRMPRSVRANQLFRLRRRWAVADRLQDLYLDLAPAP